MKGLTFILDKKYESVTLLGFDKIFISDIRLDSIIHQKGKECECTRQVYEYVCDCICDYTQYMEITLAELQEEIGYEHYKLKV